MQINNTVNNLITNQVNQTNKTNHNQQNLGKQDFLRLLVTQLNNQNPLNVQQNSEFVAQLTGFANLESLDNLNYKIASLVSNKQTENQLNASNLLGKNIKVATNNANLQQGEHITGSVKSTSNNLKLEIYNEQGQKVHEITLTGSENGEFSFDWDGLDANGQKLANGKYTFINQEAPNNVYLNSKVTGVELNNNGAIYLNTTNLNKISFNQITNIGS